MLLPPLTLPLFPKFRDTPAAGYRSRGILYQSWGKQENAVSSSSGYTKALEPRKFVSMGGGGGLWLYLCTSSPFFFKKSIPKLRKKNLKSLKNLFFRDRFILKFGFSKIYES